MPKVKVTELVKKMIYFRFFCLFRVCIIKCQPSTPGISQDGMISLVMLLYGNKFCLKMFTKSPNNVSITLHLYIINNQPHK